MWSLFVPFAPRARGSLLAHPFGMVTDNAFVHPPPSLVAHSSSVVTGNAFVHRRVLAHSVRFLSDPARRFLFCLVEPHLPLVLRRFPVHGRCRPPAVPAVSLRVVSPGSSDLCS